MYCLILLYLLLHCFALVKLLVFLYSLRCLSHMRTVRKKVLPSDMHSLGKALERGTLKVAHAAFQCPSLRPHIEELVGKDVSRECKNLCSLSSPSIIHSMSKDTVVKFSWAAVSEELKSHCQRKPGSAKRLGSADFLYFFSI